MDGPALWLICKSLMKPVVVPGVPPSYFIEFMGREYYLRHAFVFHGVFSG